MADKTELEKKNQFYRVTIDQLESELKKATGELKMAKFDEAILDDGTLMPQQAMASMKERLKSLEKENALLKTELENKFDKDKAITQAKLQDALRENTKLTQANELMSHQLSKLQEKVS